ncbi:MAG: biotin/lipoyl-binding protein, partial [Oceanipulchritudo sp.]
MPWFILLGLVVVFLVLFGGRLLPAQEVLVKTVVTEESLGGEGEADLPEASPHEGESLFQASGWIEADPFPVRATALISGVVEHVHVLEGQTVKAGDPIATLVRKDAEIALAAAKAAREAAESERAVEEAEREVLAAAETVLQSRIRAAESRLTELADLAERAERVGMGNLSEREIVQARLKEATQQVEVETLRASLSKLAAERLQQERRETLRRARVREA